MPHPTPLHRLMPWLLLPGLPAVAEAQETVLASFQREVEPIFDEYCYDCHGFGNSEGGVTLDEFTGESIQDHELWMRILRNARAHIMPPLGEAHPTAAERAEILAWVKRVPFNLDAADPDPGQLTVQRLNRTEYENTIRDLTGVDFDAHDAFPPDNSGEGFDNIGDLLTLSPMMLEKYFDAAINIIGEAVPTQPWVIPSHRFEEESLVNLFSSATIEDDASDEYLQMSFYEPSERLAGYTVTRPGRYQVVVQLQSKSFSSFQGFDYHKCHLTMTIDGKVTIDREFQDAPGRTSEFVFDYDWEPGEHTLRFAVEPTTADQDLEQIKRLKVRVKRLTIKGPFAREHWVRPASYARFFGEGPPRGKFARRSYTRKLIRDFATRAFRRPVDRSTVKYLAGLAEEISANERATFEAGVSQAMVAVLASPRFLFREEGLLKPRRGSDHVRVDEYALASRLSYFLWSSMPDEELMQLAAAGKLRANLDAQLDRLLADGRSDAFMENFSGQWLHARDIQGVNINSFEVWLRENPDPELAATVAEYAILREIPDQQRTAEQAEAYTRTRAVMRRYRDMDRPELRWREQNSMREETERYFEYVFREDRPIAEFLDSDYTFVNDRLARHYGIDGVTGPHMRRITLEPDSPRGGVLTQGTLLAYTSNATRTSPVKRGVFILENILGTPPAAPPPNIPALEDVASPDELQTLSLRDTLAIHREQPLCASCHNRMDPLGLAFENFNALGIWREGELGQAIEPGGQLVTGETFSSIQELKHILATDRLNDFYYCFSEKMLTFALGRGLEYYDTVTVDHLVETLVQSGGRPSALMKAIVHSTPFQKTRHL